MQLLNTIKHGFFASVFFCAIGAADNIVNASPLASPSTNTSNEFQVDTSSETKLPHIKLADVNTGQLLFKQTNTGLFLQAPQLTSTADINVQGIVANATIKQVFSNTTNEWQHALYVFPLPDDAAVNALTIKFAEREIIGVVKEKKQAKRIFNQAKKNGKKAALMEQLRPNLFSMQVANIPPNESITVELTYFQQVSFNNNEFSLHFPMAITPRYTPNDSLSNSFGRKEKINLKGEKLSEGESFIPNPNVANLLFKTNTKRNDELADTTIKVEPLNKINFNLTLNSGSPLAKLKSLNHTVMIEQKSSDIFTLRLHEHPLDKDFELVWQYPEQSVPKILNFHDDFKGQRYGLLMVLPSAIKEKTIANAIHDQARQLTFILDKSGSMSGQSMQQAKLAFKHALKTLANNDTFQLIIFNNKAERFFEKPVAATDYNKNTAWQHVSNLSANGGTEIQSALALALLTSNESVQGENVKSESAINEKLEQIVFLTDGAVGNEADIFTFINQNIANKRLFTVGLGTAPNRYFMKRAAEAGRGSYQFIGSHKQLVPEMNKLFHKLDNPQLTDIQFNLKNQQNAIITSPNPIPDLYHGDPIFLSYQLKADSNEVNANNNGTNTAQPALITANYQGQEWQLPLNLNQTDRSKKVMGYGDKNTIPALATLWARRKIDDHYRELMLYRDQEAKQQIIDLALTFNLVTPFTSLVAVENVVSRPSHLAAKNKQLKNNLPAGQAMPKTALNWQWQFSIALISILLALSFLLLNHYLRWPYHINNRLFAQIPSQANKL